MKNDLRRIYVARGLQSGLVKIGCTHNVHQRAQGLARQCREGIEVIAVISGTLATERSLHERFAAIRAEEPGRNSEWYRDDGTISAWVATLPDAARGSHVAPYRGPVSYARVRRSPEERAAARAAEIRQMVKRFAARHGHAYSDGFVSVCLRCAGERRAWSVPRARPVTGSLPGFLRPAAGV